MVPCPKASVKVPDAKKRWGSLGPLSRHSLCLLFHESTLKNFNLSFSVAGIRKSPG